MEEAITTDSKSPGSPGSPRQLAGPAEAAAGAAWMAHTSQTAGGRAAGARAEAPPSDTCSRTDQLPYRSH